MDEDKRASAHWPLGGKLDGLIVPASDIRTQDNEARNAQAPSHLAKRSIFSCLVRSGRT